MPFPRSSAAASPSITSLSSLALTTRPPHFQLTPSLGSHHLGRRCLTPACSGLASLAADARRYAAQRAHSRSRLMHFQPDSPGPAGFALRTPGDSRRGRCEKRTGAVSAMFHHAAVHTASARVGITSSSPAPRRFAPPAARPSSRRSSVAPARSLASGSRFCPSLARPCSAHAPGLSSTVFLFVLVEPSAIVLSSSALRWPGSPAGNPRSAPPTLSGCLPPALSRAQPRPARRITRRAADFASLRSLAADAHG